MLEVGVGLVEVREAHHGVWDDQIGALNWRQSCVGVLLLEVLASLARVHFTRFALFLENVLSVEGLVALAVKAV